MAEASRLLPVLAIVGATASFQLGAAPSGPMVG